MPVSISATAIRKAFIFQADPDATGQPYIAIADENAPQRGIYLGVGDGPEAGEVLLEHSDVDAAALKSRWSALSRLRVANRPTELVLHNGTDAIAHIRYSHDTNTGLSRTYTSLAQQTAQYLRQTVRDSDFPFPYFDPTFHFITRQNAPSELWLRMKFFDGATGDILLQQGFEKYKDADAAWGPSMDAFTLQLEDVSGAPSDQKVVIYDTGRNPVRSIPYDSASPEGHRASQAAVMEAIRESYVLFRTPKPLRLC